MIYNAFILQWTREEYATTKDAETELYLNVQDVHQLPTVVLFARKTIGSNTE